MVDFHSFHWMNPWISYKHILWFWPQRGIGIEPIKSELRCPGNLWCTGEVSLLGFLWIFLGCYQNQPKSFYQSIFYDYSNIEGMRDQIVNIIEIMLHWEDKSIHWGKIRKYTRQKYWRGVLVGAFTAAVFFMCLFLRKLICVIFSTTVSKNYTHWYWSGFYTWTLSIFSSPPTSYR